MLGDKIAVATIAVKDLNAARRFYKAILGLKASGSTDSSEVVTYKAGNSSVLVYCSQFAGTNKAKAATWVVGDDVEGTAQALKAKGAQRRCAYYRAYQSSMVQRPGWEYSQHRQ
jgi:catechol 2,3-dioxygenase-like lactoylglutathione lyase family enzyme